jgi:hypothetical protein
VDPKQAAFLPFHALNEFMRTDYRQTVIHSVITRIPSLTENQQKAVNQAIKKMVQVPGFRNSLQAPAPMKVKPAIQAFEKSPAFVAVVLSAWAELNQVLRQQVFDLLVSRGWDVLPPDADRTKLPGFLTTWPKDDDFPILNQAFSETYPDAQASTDDVSLMAVWLAGRLPMEQVDSEPSEEEELDKPSDQI